MNGVYEGLCLPISNMATLLASLPSTTSSASSTCQSRLISGLDGNSVLIDTRLHSFRLKILRLANGPRECQIRPHERRCYVEHALAGRSGCFFQLGGIRIALKGGPMRFLTAILLISAARAGTITSASVTFPGPLGCPYGDIGGTVTGTDSASINAPCDSLFGPYGAGTASAHAAIGQLSASSGVNGHSFTPQAAAVAQYTDTATISGSTVIFQFKIDGTFIRDGGATSALFTISVPGASDSISFEPSGHFLKIDQ